MLHLYIAYIIYIYTFTYNFSLLVESNVYSDSVKSISYIQYISNQYHGLHVH
jgi:hypothetical protein